MKSTDNSRVTVLDAAAAALHVSLHAADLRDGRVHGHAQRARPFFHTRNGRVGDEHGDDCVGLFPRAADGRDARPANFALAIGVLVAGVAQAALQLPWLRADGFRYHWVSPWRDETVRRVVRQMIPGTIGVAAFQINMLVTQSIAFWVDPSIVAWFTEFQCG